MKVRLLSIVVEVDAEAWTTTYGVEGIPEIRADVQAYVRDLINDSAAADECGLRIAL